MASIDQDEQEVLFTKDPLRGFRFEVEVSRFTSKVGFMKVSGLGGDMTPEEWQEITDPVTTLKFPNEIKFGDVVLERGVDYNNECSRWWEEVMTASMNMKQLFRETVRIRVKDKGITGPGQGNRVWTIHRAFPISFKVSELDALGSGVLIQTLVLANEGIVMENV